MNYLNDSEKEYFNNMTNWFMKTGWKYFTAIISVLLIIGIWQGYDYYKSNQIKHDAKLFFALQSNIDKNEDVFQSQLAELVKSDNVYSDFAEFMVAKKYFLEEEYNKSSEQLKKIIARNRDNFIVEIALYRLANVYFQQNNLTDAQKSLDRIKELSPFADELKGDIALAQGDNVKAITLYQKALEFLIQSNLDTTSLQLKINNLRQS